MQKIEVGKLCPYGHLVEGENVLRYSVESPRNGVRWYLKCRTCWESPKLRKARERYHTVIVPERERRDLEALIHGR